MPKHRTPLPPELKELIGLIREGRLFEVQRWIAGEKPLRPPKHGHFIIWPMLAAMRTGFHSIIEVLLDALKDAEDLDHLLYEAVSMARLDLIELTHRFGADPKSIDYETIASTHNPLILRWFEDRGVDLETDLPLAAAFRWRKRVSLGTYMRFRKKMPQLQLQADIALRHHAGEGDLKWVCLLLWAGANPRAEVPDVDGNDSNGNKRSALAEAIRRGHFEIVKKFKVDRTKDDLNGLLYETWLTSNRQIVELLLGLGADPKAEGEDSVIRTYMLSLGWALESDSPFRRDFRQLTDILCLFAAKGARWQPRDGHEYRSFRKGIYKAEKYDALEVLRRFVESGFISQEVFRQLASVPRLRELLDPGPYGNSKLWDFAGFPSRQRRARTSRRRGEAR